MASQDRQPPTARAVSTAGVAPGPRRRPRAIWANALLLLTSLVVGLVAIELALGSTHYRYLTQPRVDYPPGYFQNDAELGADLAANRPPATVRMRGPSFVAFTNQWGCFDHDRPIGENYLLAVGDSSTWGYAALEDKWTSHLEMLSSRRVLKCGVSGTGPKYQQIKARKTIAKVGASPAIILVLYDTWNDFNDDVVFPGYGVVDGYRGHTLKSLDLRTGKITRHTPEAFEQKYRRYALRQAGFSLSRTMTRHLTIAALISHLFTERPPVPTAPADGSILDRRDDFSLWKVDPATYPWIEQAFEEHVRNIRALQRLADEHGAALVLIADGIPDTGLHARLRAILEHEMPYFIDLAGPMAKAAQGQRVTWHHDGHWNALGNRLAAKALHRYLQDAGLL